jgi:tetrahydromethanopterin S-methyltransferase subunit E
MQQNQKYLFYITPFITIFAAQALAMVYRVFMAKRIPLIQLIVLFLIVLAGICKPAARVEKAAADYQINLPSHAALPVNDTGEAILLPATGKAIVQTAHFNLAQEFLFVIGLVFSVLLVFKAAVFKAPLFTISYFDNTFCHLIAINAP